MSMIRSIRFRSLRIKLPVRCAEPTLTYRGVRVESSLKHHLLAGAIKHAKNQENICVPRRGGHVKLQRRGAGNLRILLHGRSEECDPFALHRLVLYCALPAGSRFRQCLRGRIKVKVGPPRSCQRPFALQALSEPVDRSDVEYDLGLLLPAVVNALEEVVKEPPLKVKAITRVELRPVLPPVKLEPLLL